MARKKIYDWFYDLDNTQFAPNGEDYENLG